MTDILLPRGANRYWSAQIRKHLPCESFTRRGDLPTALRTGPYRFYFYSHDLREPPHVHVDAGDKTAKLWLNPVTVARNIGFTTVELNCITRLVGDYREQFIKAWHEHFS